jgi:hypothetical protein
LFTRDDLGCVRASFGHFEVLRDISRFSCKRRSGEGAAQKLNCGRVVERLADDP